MKNTCKDCGKELSSRRAVRCRACSDAYRHACRKNICADCGKSLGSGKTRCRDCYVGYLRATENHCVDCATPIRRGQARCRACYVKHCAAHELPASFCARCKEPLAKRSAKHCKECSMIVRDEHYRAESQYLLEEYRFFRGFGYAEDKVHALLANKLGLTVKTVHRRLTDALVAA